MTEKITTFKLKWENSNHFTMTCDNGEENKTVVQIEENGHIATLWPDVESICAKFFLEKVQEVGKEMKSS